MTLGTSVRDAYRRFFDEKPEQTQAVEDAKDWADGTLALWEQRAFIALIEKLETVANAPIPLNGDPGGLAAAVGRSNGLKEAVQIIKSDLARARRVSDATQPKGD